MGRPGFRDNNRGGGGGMFYLGIYIYYFVF